MGGFQAQNPPNSAAQHNKDLFLPYITIQWRAVEEFADVPGPWSFHVVDAISQHFKILHIKQADEGGARGWKIE